MKSFKELIDETSRLKKADSLEFKVKSSAAVAHIKGDEKAEEKHKNRLHKITSFKNKLLATEGSSPDYHTVDVDIQSLHNHITKQNPSTSDITKMHDMVRNLSKKHNMGIDQTYALVQNNQQAHPKFKEAASD